MEYRFKHKVYKDEPTQDILKDYPELNMYISDIEKLDLDKIRELINPSVVYDFIYDRISKQEMINKMLDRLEIEGVIHG